MDHVFAYHPISGYGTLEILQEIDLDRKNTRGAEKKAKGALKDENKEKREKIFDRARKVIDVVKKTDWKSKEYEANVMDFEGENELFQGEEDEEENDYNILYDLNDYNKNSQPSGGLASKSAFKTKLFSKGRLKVKLK